MAIKFLHNLDVQGNLDLNNKELKNIQIQQLASDPGGASPTKGSIYYNTGTNKLRYCAGTTSSDWTDIGSSSTDGDITAVLSGTRISVTGGATGDATVNLAAATVTEIEANTSKISYDSTSSTKVGHLTVTGATDLDTMRSDVSTNNSKVSMALGTTASTALAGNTTTISASQASAISTNSAKTGITSTQADAITANSAKTGISSSQASAISTNSAKTGITSTQAGHITANNLKVTFPGLGTSSTTALAGNTTTISGTQASNITTNNSKVSYPGTADATELNILDGATISTAQLNRCDATSSIQTQIDTKAPTASPTLTGTPVAPTADAGADSTQIATTAFVSTAVANLIDNAPANLNTLNELAEALNDDDDAIVTINSSLAGKSPTAGNTSLTTVGTIGTGTWQGTAINQTYLVGQSGTNTGDESDANTTTKGIVEIATVTEAKAGDSGAVVVTPAGLAARTYTTTIGDGESTSIAVSHSLGTKKVIVQMFDSSSFEDVYAQVVRNSTSQVTIDFLAAPSSNDVTVLVTKIGGDL